MCDGDREELLEQGFYSAFPGVKDGRV